MRPEARDAAHLWDMMSAAREAHAIVEFITVQQFLADRIRLRALVGQRNLLAHEYGRIDPALLYASARKHVPTLIAALKGIVAAPRI